MQIAILKCLQYVVLNNVMEYMSDDGGDSYNLREYFSHVSPKLGANTARMYSLEQLRARRRGLLVRRGVHEALRAPQPHLRRLPQGTFRPRFLYFLHS